MADVPFVTWPFPISAIGAVSRTLPARLKDRINVLDFGADPTGTNDSHDAFAAAIAAATTTSRACGSVYVQRGRYKFASSLSLLPGGPGATNSFNICGEAAGCTELFGNISGYILDAGTTVYAEGGYSISNLSVRNNNPTPFTSGCVRLGGIAPTINSCLFSGMVEVNFTGAVSPRISDSMLQTPNAGAFGGAIGSGNIGILMAGDGGVIENTCAQLCDVAYAISGRGIIVHGCHLEVCRRGIVLGYRSVDTTLGLGYAYGVAILGTAGEEVAIQVDVMGPTSGFISGFGGQMHGDGFGATLNPEPSDPAYASSTKFGVRVADGCALGISFFDGSAATAPGSCDPAGAAFQVGMPPTGNIRTGGCFFKAAAGAMLPAPAWRFPGTAGGNAAQAGAANSARLLQCDFVPIWAYNDLPWGTMTGFTISSLSFSYSGSTRLTPEIGATLKGSGITAGTKILTVDTVAKTGTVDKTQTVGSTTATFFCNNPGDQYELLDSVDPIWTGSASNAGKPIATGGGSNRVSVAFNENSGYVLVG